MILTGQPALEEGDCYIRYTVTVDPDIGDSTLVSLRETGNLDGVKLRFFSDVEITGMDLATETHLDYIV